jgi:hypothetical protein
MEQAVKELEQTEMHDIAAKLGTQWRLVYEYSDCFRQSEYGDVSLEKRLRIFRSIVRLFDSMQFSYQGKTYRTSWHEATRAMTEICNMAKWGFRNHHYLFAMLIKKGERVSAEGLTATEERVREERRQHGAHNRQHERDEFFAASPEEARREIIRKIQKLGVQHGTKTNGR